MSGAVYVGTEQYSSHGGGTLVPADERRVTFTTDGSGSWQGSFVWPVHTPGTVLAVQAAVRDGQGGECLSNAFLGTTLTTAEALAFDYAVSCGSSSQDFSPWSVDEVLEIQSSTDQDAAFGMVFAGGALPNFDNDESFAVGTISQYATQIDPIALQEYEGRLIEKLAYGTTFVQITWKMTMGGSFTSYAIADTVGSEIVLDTFAEQFWTEVQPTSLLGIPYAGEFTVYRPWGPVAAQVNGEVAMTCEDGQVNVCGGNATHSAGIGFDAVSAIVCETSAQGDCCVCQWTWGVASGFKSVKVSASGVGIEIGGSLGRAKGGTHALSDCCE